ncbi:MULTISPECIES: RHS repeat-associated core domain-containing protein [Pseudomonas]|uniref:RHS repeat-associated core domain-containing protein n=1 Tax=Pseudomonas TaxID=286 RepID=UPI001FF1D628|nr:MULTISPECIES: RHS repeat-associated core domain-containing protein [Pseudomonas]
MPHAAFRLGVLALACGFLSLPVSATTLNYTYTALGQIATVDGPRTDVSDITSFAYDTQGNLTTVTNALGQVSTRANFDSYGNPQTVTDPNGVVTTLTYTPQGWLASSSIAGATTQYTYNAVGDLTQITAPDGSFLAYTYDDARRLIAVTNTLGETQSYVLDAMGNRTSAQLKDASGTLTRQQQSTYDELGRLLTQVGAGGQTTRYAYDLNDQLTQKTDARSNATNQAFDALGRVTQVTDPLGGITALTYNTDNQITQLVDPRGVTTQYVYDAEGRVLQIQSPDGGTSNFTYDEAGNVSQRTDARGIITTYQYDALNRLIAQHYPATPALDVLYTYDQTDGGNRGIGRLTSIQDPSGTVAYVYDDRGQRIAQNRALNLAGLNINASTTYSYDTAGRVAQQGYPDNVAVSYARNNAGQVNAVSLTLNGQNFPIAANIAYAPFGPLTQLTWGNGLTLSRTYDQDYQLTTQIIGNWQNQYGFDPVGNITRQQSNLWGAVQYQYDALNRLTREQSATTQKDYALDAVGNRTQRTTTDLASATVTETQTATVATDSNRLATVEGLTLPYDTAGNLQQNTTGLRYTYDDSGRMNAVYQAGAQRIASFTYNNLGQRTLKLTFDPVSGALVSGSTYLYGPGGEVIGQADYGANGQRLVTRYWIWLDGMPLAQVELNYTQGVPSGFQLVYLHSDHLNTPRLASTNQGIVWSWISDAYGAALPNEDVAGSGTATHIPLRFPGQLYDAQTQLSYNYYRDYDANLGRYVQSDPIGLGGGLNAYGYVGGNPLSFADPFGLQTSVTIWQPVGMGESSFGHVSVDINGQTYSFGPGGMTILPTTEYVDKNGFREGTAVSLSLTPKQETALESCLSSPQGNYRALTNNCGSPVQNCLKAQGIDTSNQLLPVSLGNKLIDKGITNGVISYPATRPSKGWSAPWAR